MSAAYSRCSASQAAAQHVERAIMAHYGSRIGCVALPGHAEVACTLSTCFPTNTGRARSAYNHFGHSCHSNFSSFEAQMRGTAVTMVTGQRTYGLTCIACGSNCKPLIPDVKRAVDRLDTFAFVGLVEEWALSICLLHTMHGPTFHSERCNAAEFGNSRKAGQICALLGQPDRVCNLAHAHMHLRPDTTDTSVSAFYMQGELQEDLQRRHLCSQR